MTDNVYRPKVSIIIPAYCASNYLAQAIDSALSQTYGNIEVIVVNDGSDDQGSTRAVALSYGNRIHYVEKSNGGSSSALNLGIRMMTGEWFSWLSHDDLYLPEKIEENVRALNDLNLPRAEMWRHAVVSAARYMDGGGRPLRIPVKRRMQKMAGLVERAGNAGLIAEPARFTFHGCAYFVHRELFNRVGGFDESLWLLNDWDMWFRMLREGVRLHYIPKALVIGRVHPAQVSGRYGYSYQNREQDFYWQRCLDYLMADASENPSLLRRFGRNAYQKTRYAEVICTQFSGHCHLN